MTQLCGGCSRARGPGTPTGAAHIDIVIPPDEYHQGNDSVYTNVVATLALRFAGEVRARPWRRPGMT
jgi:trehalose/maltose hydrolase-like predicted phosphorylase